MEDKDGIRRWLRLRTVCARYDVSPYTIRNWIRKHAFPRPMRVSANAPDRFDLRAIEKWEMARQRKRAQPKPRGRLMRGTELGGRS